MSIIFKQKCIVISVSPTTIQTESTTTRTDTTTPCTGVTPVVGIIEAVPAWCIIVTVVLAALCLFLLMIILIICCRLRWAYNTLRNEGSKEAAKELTKIARPPVGDANRFHNFHAYARY